MKLLDDVLSVTAVSSWSTTPPVWHCCNRAQDEAAAAAMISAHGLLPRREPRVLGGTRARARRLPRLSGRPVGDRSRLPVGGRPVRPSPPRGHRGAGRGAPPVPHR